MDSKRLPGAAGNDGGGFSLGPRCGVSTLREKMAVIAGKELKLGKAAKGILCVLILKGLLPQCSMGQPLLQGLDIIKDSQTKRISSWDKTGANADAIKILPGRSYVLADIKGPGKITHIWMTQMNHYRDCLIKITWDNAPNPSVLCPLGDFFCLGNDMVNSFESALFTASTRFPYRMNWGVALNCYVPMYFKERAVIELVNQSQSAHHQYYYIDYEVFREPPKEKHGYFHAEFRRAYPWRGWNPKAKNTDDEIRNFPNKERNAWENNYVILETKGKGHYIGCNISVANFGGDWWGEGDEMIWIDGYKWPPDIHGTGSEDYFNQAWGMNKTAFLHNGSSIWEGLSCDDTRYSGAAGASSPKITGGYQTSYVFHIENPVRFQKEIKVTIEAGHANFQGNEISSVAYWYTENPTKVMDPPPVDKRQPVLKNNQKKWLIDKTKQWPGKEVRENDDFKKAKAEFDQSGKK